VILEEQVAYMDGRSAYKNGRRRSDNPYSHECLRRCWFFGFDKEKELAR
jgi:hypothetical protein